MNTQELIEILTESLENDGNLEVYSSSNYGDYHNTEQLNNIVDVVPIIPDKTAYSGTGFCFPKKDKCEFDNEVLGTEEEEKMVLVLRYTY